MNIATFTSKKFLTYGLIILIFIAVATLPFYSPLFGWSSRELYRPGIALLYIALSVSWVMFSGSTGYMSLGIAAFMGVGIYAMALLREELPFGIIILLSGVIAFVLALLVGLVTLRLRGIFFAIFTFGFVVLIQRLALYYDIHIVGIRGRSIPPTTYEIFYWTTLAVAVAALLTAYFVRRSRLGLAMQSIGQNEQAAAHMGVNTTMVKVISFAISAIFMGVAGATLAARIIFVDPIATFHLGYSFTPVLMAIFGGMGHLFGPVIGAIIFSALEFWLMGSFPLLYGLIFGIILVIAILYLPGGLVGLIPVLRNRLKRVIPKLGKGG